MYLADGGSGDRLGREKGEDLLGACPELGLDHFGDLVGSERRHVILEPGQRRLEQVAVGRGDHAVDVDKGEDLAYFHDCALHVAQDLGVALGEPLLAGALRGLGGVAAGATVHAGLGPGGHGVPGQPGQANRAADPSGGQLAVRAIAATPLRVRGRVPSCSRRRSMGGRSKPKCSASVFNLDRRSRCSWQRSSSVKSAQ